MLLLKLDNKQPKQERVNLVSRMRYEEMEHRFLCGNFSGDVFYMGFLDKENRTGFKDFCLFH